MPPYIASPANPRIKALARLHTSRERRATGRFLIEGQREVERAVAAAWPLEGLYVCRDLSGGDSAARAVPDLSVTEVSRSVFQKLSLREHPDGVLAVARERPWALEDLALAQGAAPLLLVLEGLEKPGNLGAVLRTASAAGAAAVLCVDARIDPCNPQTIRASQGAFFVQPTYFVSSDAALDWLAAEGIPCVATSPAAGALYWDADLHGPVALVLGAEATGLTDRWIEAAASTVRLPMQGLMDSLNLSVSAGLMLYEALRQRTQ